RALRPQVPGIHGLASVRVADEDPAQPFLKVRDATRQAEDGHDLRRDGDVKPALPGHAVGQAAETDNDMAQRAVVDVQHPGPQDAAGIQSQFVALVDVVVDQGRQQVVGGADCVDVACKVQVDLVGGDDAGAPAAGGAAFDAKH